MPTAYASAKKKPSKQKVRKKRRRKGARRRLRAQGIELGEPRIGARGIQMGETSLTDLPPQFLVEHGEPTIRKEVPGGEMLGYQVGEFKPLRKIFNPNLGPGPWAPEYMAPTDIGQYRPSEFLRWRQQQELPPRGGYAEELMGPFPGYHMLPDANMDPSLRPEHWEYLLEKHGAPEEVKKSLRDDLYAAPKYRKYYPTGDA